jgi:sulfur-oxidizing protein SoxX
MKAGAALVSLLLPLAAYADEAAQRRAEQIVRESFAAAPEEWAARMRQDDAQLLCSRYRNQLPPELAEQITASQRGAMRYPPSGTLVGDWKSGQALARIGGGGQIGSIQPDPPGTRRGGNCYACHALAAGEVAAGTIGPSLTNYARQRGTSRESIRYVYEKIYNPQAFVACSLMPRFGHNSWLTPEEIADIVAFLLDPASPVNKE